MSNDTPAALQTAATAESIDLEPRDVRALTECMTVLPETSRARGADDLFLVVSESGREYLVDRETDACECLDSTKRGALCKHRRRVAFATGAREIPAWADRDAIDSQLGHHVSGGPRQAATDGGDVIVAGDDAEILDESDAQDDTPDDCDCGDLGGDVPCWDCYRTGRKGFPEDL